MSAPPLLTQPLHLRLLLDEAARVARVHFRRIFPGVAVPLALAGGAVPLAQGVFFKSLAGGAMDPAALLVGGSAFAVVTFVFWIVYVISYAALIAAAMDAVAGREVSMRRAWLTMARPRVFGTLLLVGMVAMAGMMCCLLPGLYAGLLFSLAVPVMVEEDTFGPAAMRRSAELAKYNPRRRLEEDPRFKVFLIFLVGTLLGYMINMLVQLPAAVAQQFLMMRDVAGGERADPGNIMVTVSWMQVPTNMLSMATSTAVNLYICFGLALLFFDVRGRKEGLDLEAAVARLAASRGAPPVP